MRVPALIVAITLLTVACGDVTAPSSTSTVPPQDSGSLVAVEERLDELDRHVAAWRSAETLEAAQAAAEAAANLVTGPGGPGFGDRDGDGATQGSSDAGLLPGLDGSPGLALAAQRDQTTSCLERDLLGGSWDDAAARWAELDAAVAEWRPDNNTYPFLASHPQRVVGWARLTLATDSLGRTREYAGHAGLHVRISRNELAGC